MKHHLWLAGLLFAAAAAAETFYLVDGQGQRHGPFAFRDGEKLAVGDRTLTLSLPASVKPTLGQKLEKTVIPAISFRQAGIAEVVEFLQQASVEFSPFPEPHKGVNLVLNLRGRSAAEIARITFSAQAIPLGDAIDAVVRAANLRMRIQGTVVMIEPAAPAK